MERAYYINKETKWKFCIFESHIHIEDGVWGNEAYEMILLTKSTSVENIGAICHVFTKKQDDICLIFDPTLYS